MVIQGFNAYFNQNPLLVMYLIVHFLVDFHFQSPTMAARKITNLRYVVYHLLALALGYGVLLVVWPQLWASVILIIISHTLIDLTKYLVTRRLTLTHNQMVSLLVGDQLLHVVSMVMINEMVKIAVALPMTKQFLLLILFGVLVTKPVNILFKSAFSRFQSPDIDAEETVKGAGAMVGNLERIAMGILMLLGQFASVGLVFTAKSIARYNKISDSPSFAEYYLIGSLYSIIAVLFCYWLLFY